MEELKNFPFVDDKIIANLTTELEWGWESFVVGSTSLQLLSLGFPGKENIHHLTQLCLRRGLLSSQLEGIRVDQVEQLSEKALERVQSYCLVFNKLQLN